MSWGWLLGPGQSGEPKQLPALRSWEGWSWNQRQLGHLRATSFACLCRMTPVPGYVRGAFHSEGCPENPEHGRAGRAGVRSRGCLSFRFQT